MILIQEIASQATYPLRIEILRNGIKRNYRFDNDEVATSIHLGAFEDTELVGIVSFIQQEHKDIEDKEAYQLRGMAVTKNRQNSGIGSFLIKESLKYLKKRKCQTIWCNARESAINFYVKHNFSKNGESFIIPKIGIHYMMYKQI